MNTLADPLRRAVQVAGGDVALVDGEEQFTYWELDERCRRLAAALSQLGLVKGDRVAILAANRHEYIETYLAVPAAGMVIVPLNTRHARAELAYALEDAGARVLLTDRSDHGLGHLVEHVIALEDDLEARLSRAEPAPLGQDVVETDLAGLFYTGGTTGKSKGVMLSHRNLISNASLWLSTVAHSSDDRALVMAPLFHAAGSNGILANVWTAGRQVVLAAFDPEAALDLIERHGITMTLGVPTMLSALAEAQHARPRRVDSLRMIAHGGSPIATEVVRRTSAAFPNAQLIEVYGATELSPLATALHAEQTQVDSPRARSCGRSIPGTEVRVLDSEGKELPRGEVGEVVVRGPNVMQGYWRKQEQTAAVLKSGAYWTGDLGYMDEERYLFLVDRSKDMIVSGGENVYSTEVEEVLFQHPAVLEAAAFGIPHEKWGEAVHAVVVTRPGHDEVSPEEIIEFCRERIAGYKLPKSVELRREALPKSGPGKVLKRELRAPYWEDRDRDIS